MGGTLTTYIIYANRGGLSVGNSTAQGVVKTKVVQLEVLPKMKAIQLGVLPKMKAIQLGVLPKKTSP